MLDRVLIEDVEEKILMTQTSPDVGEEEINLRFELLSLRLSMKDTSRIIHFFHAQNNFSANIYEQSFRRNLTDILN